MVPDRQKVRTDGMDGRTHGRCKTTLRLRRGIKIQQFCERTVIVVRESHENFVRKMRLNLVQCFFRIIGSDLMLSDSVLCLGQDFWGTQVSLYLNFRGTFTNSGGHTKFSPVN